MGDEFGQEREWNHDAQLDWDLLDNPAHRGVQRLVRDLNRLYTAEPALHARDGDDTGFSWVVADDWQQSVFAYLRMSGGNRPPCWRSATSPPSRETATGLACRRPGSGAPS